MSTTSLLQVLASLFPELYIATGRMNLLNWAGGLLVWLRLCQAGAKSDWRRNSRNARYVWRRRLRLGRFAVGVAEKSENHRRLKKSKEGDVLQVGTS